MTTADLTALAGQYQERLLREANLDRLAALPVADLRQVIGARVGQMLAADRLILPRAAQEWLQRTVADEVVGYGPLEPLLADSTVTEIMVNAPDEVYVERHGQIERTGISFRDQDHVRHIIERMIARIGRRIDESSPMVDARLPDGSRVNAVVAPVSLAGPVLTVRKFRSDPFSLADLTAGGSLSAEMAAFLSAAVRGRLNTLISGGTGSGKTTLLAALAAHIPAGERVITIEDMAELRLPRRHVVRLEARPPNVEGRGEITIRHLVRNALRMRPDRIIVGEVRGGEALDMLQAMNTGHDGSLTTVHANSPQDAFSRLEAMVIMAGARLPVPVVRAHLGAALHLVVQVERLPDGSRRVMNISEVTGGGAGGVQVSPVFWYERGGMGADGLVYGWFRSAGRLPRCWQRLEAAGVAPDPAVFG